MSDRLDAALDDEPVAVVDPLGVAARWPWRVGRKVGRTIYAHPPDHADGGVLIGMMDTRELAEVVVHAHNRTIGAET